MAGRPPLHEPAERRALIESAATSLFAEVGFTAATMDEVVTRSGISKPAVYRAYPSKSHLYAAVIERAANDAAAAALDAFAAAAGSTADRLLAMIDAWFAQVERDATPHRLAARDVPDDPVVAEAAARIKAMQVGNDVRLMRALAPQLPHAEVEPLGEVIRSSLLSLARWWSDHPEVPREVPVAVMTRICVALTTA